MDTANNLADVFTKPLSGALFSKFADMLLSPLVGQASLCLLRVRYHRRRWYERTASDSDSESSDAAYARYELEEHKERGDFDDPPCTTPAPEAAAPVPETVSPAVSPSYSQFPFEQSVPSPEPAPVPVHQMGSLVLHPMPMPCCAGPRPVATLQCMGCEGISTLGHCNVVCAECQGNEFRWFCKCMVENTFSYAHEDAKLGFHARDGSVRGRSPVPFPSDFPFVDPPSGSDDSTHGRAELISAQAVDAPSSPLDPRAEFLSATDACIAPPCDIPSTTPATPAIPCAQPQAVDIDMPVHSGCCEACAGLDPTCPCWVHYYDDEDSE